MDETGEIEDYKDTIKDLKEELRKKEELEKVRDSLNMTEGRQHVRELKNKEHEMTDSETQLVSLKENRGNFAWKRPGVPRGELPFEKEVDKLKLPEVLIQLKRDSVWLVMQIMNQ